MFWIFAVAGKTCKTEKTFSGLYIGWSYYHHVTQSNLLLKPAYSEFYLAGFWKPAGMGTAQPHWATCHTAWLPSQAESFSLYPVWTFPFSCYLLSLTNNTVLSGLGLGKTLEHVLKTCWFQPPGACPGRRQGPGHACVLSFLLLSADSSHCSVHCGSAAFLLGSPQGN